VIHLLKALSAMRSVRFRYLVLCFLALPWGCGPVDAPPGGSGGQTASGGGTASGGALVGGGASGGGASGGGSALGVGGGSQGSGGGASGGLSGSGGGSIGGAPGSGGAIAGGAPGAGGATGTGGLVAAGGQGAGGGTDPGGPITIWLAGDSTVANGNTPCPAGWGKNFDALFDDSVSVSNSAAGGRSVRTWLYQVTTEMGTDGECIVQEDGQGEPLLQDRWATLLQQIHAGDYLLIQFGINDGSSTCDRHVGLSQFKEEYSMMAAAARERGAEPVFLTPVSAIACSGSTAVGTRGGYVDATFEVGESDQVPVIDLHARSIALYQQRGFCPVPGGDVSASTTGPVGDFFCDDHTHFSVDGATEIAKLVAEGLSELGLPLAGRLL
jgi:lysophospholipase L1-like esterase